jgi:hypothetical protein
MGIKQESNSIIHQTRLTGYEIRINDGRQTAQASLDLDEPVIVSFPCALLRESLLSAPNPVEPVNPV